MEMPYGIDIDNKGNIYFLDYYSRLRKISPNGDVTTLVGDLAGEVGYEDGLLSNAKFNKPQGITIDKDNNIYISDMFNHRIRKISISSDSVKLVGTPTNDDVGEHPVSLIVSDGETDVPHDFTITVNNVNDKPEVSDVQINGSVSEFATVNLSYIFKDIDKDSKESGSTYQWYLSDDNTGGNKEAIIGATTKNYTIKSSDVNKYLSVEVTPNDGIEAGEKVESSYSKVIENQAPVLVLDPSGTGASGDISDTTKWKDLEVNFLASLDDSSLASLSSTVDSKGNIFVVYSDKTTNSIITKKYDGKVWSELNSISDAKHTLFNVKNNSVLIDENDDLFVAFINNINNEASVRKYNNTSSSWENVGNNTIELGTYTSDEGSQQDLRLKDNLKLLKSEGKLYLSSQTNGGNNYILKYFEDNTWKDVENIKPEMGAKFFNISQDKNGQIYFIYNLDTKIKAKILKVENNSFIEYTSLNEDNLAVYFPLLSFDSKNRMYLTYTDGNSALNISVKRLKEDKTFEDLSSLPNIIGKAENAKLVISSDDKLYIVYSNNGSPIEIKTLKDDKSWEKIDDKGLLTKLIIFQDLLVNKDNFLIFAYESNDNKFNLKVLNLPIAGSTVIEVEENKTFVYDFEANDTENEAITYSLEGEDASLFTINSGTGILNLKTAVDFENLNDTNKDGIFKLAVVLSDVNNKQSKTEIEVKIKDVKSSINDLNINGAVNEFNTVNVDYKLIKSVEAANSDNSTYQWYLSDNNTGTNKEVIQGATNKTYTIKSSDVNKYLSVDVTPNDGIEVGDKVESSYSLVIENQAPVLDIAPLGGGSSSDINEANKWQSLNNDFLTSLAEDDLSYVSSAVDSKGVLYISYLDKNSTKVIVKKYNGESFDTFSEIDGALTSRHKTEYSSSLLIDENDEIYIAFVNSLNREPSVKKYNKSSSLWENIGSESIDLGQAESDEGGSLEDKTLEDGVRLLKAQNKLFIFAENNKNKKILKYFENNKWNDINILNITSSRHTLANNKKGELFIARDPNTLSGQLDIFKLKDSLIFEKLGNSHAGPNDLYEINLSFDSQDKLYASFYIKPVQGEEGGTVIHKYDNKSFPKISSNIAIEKSKLIVNNENIAYLFYEDGNNIKIKKLEDDKSFSDVNADNLSSFKYQNFLQRDGKLYYSGYKLDGSTYSLKVYSIPFGKKESQLEVDENKIFVYDFDANDAENEDITYSLEGEDASLFSIDSSTGVLNLKVAADFEKPNDVNTDRVYKLSIVTTDVNNKQSKTSVDIKIKDVNEKASWTKSVLNLNEDIARGFDLLSFISDEEKGKGITFTLDGESENSYAKMQINERSLIIQPKKDKTGTYKLTINAKDGKFSIPQEFTVNIGAINDVPVLSIEGKTAENKEEKVLFDTLIDSRSNKIKSTVSPNGDVYTIYSNNSKTELNVKKLNKETNKWEDLSFVDDALSDIDEYSIESDKDGAIYIAYKSKYNIYIAKYENNTWTSLGNLGSLLGEYDFSGEIKLEIDENKNIHLLNRNDKSLTYFNYSNDIWSVKSFRELKNGKYDLAVKAGNVGFIHKVENAKTTIFEKKAGDSEFIEQLSLDTTSTNKVLAIEYDANNEINIALSQDNNSWSLLKLRNKESYPLIHSINELTDSDFSDFNYNLYRDKNSELYLSAFSPSNGLAYAKLAFGKNQVIRIVGTDFKNSNAENIDMFFDKENRVYTYNTKEAEGEFKLILKSYGFETYNLDLDENQVEVISLSAVDTDEETLNFSIEGEDAQLFNISKEGKLSFKVPADFENPRDKNKDNIYLLDVLVKDSSSVDRKSIKLTINNTNEIITKNDNININSIKREENSSSIKIDLSVVIDSNELNNLEYTASSSNEDLVKVRLINNKLIVIPQENRSGLANITIKTIVDGKEIIKVLDINIDAVNNEPFIENITDITLEQKAQVQNKTINFDIWDDENINELKVLSFNNSLISNISVEKINDEKARLSYSILANATGISKVTIIANDGEFEVKENFNIIVKATNDALCVEDTKRALSFKQIKNQNIAQNYINSDLDFINTIESVCNSNITWEVSDTSVIDNDGSVIKSNEPKTVAVIASIKKGSFEVKKQFLLTVVANAISDKEAIFEVTFEMIRKLNERKNAIASNLELIASSLGKDVTWESSDESVIDSYTGVITRLSEDKNLVLKAKIGNEEKIFNLKVLALETNTKQKVKKDAKWLSFERILDKNRDNNNIIYNLIKPLPNKLQSINGSTITWESSNENVITVDGDVFRDELVDKYVSLTATITNENESIKKEFLFRVLKNEIEEENNTKFKKIDEKEESIAVVFEEDNREKNTILNFASTLVSEIEKVISEDSVKSTLNLKDILYHLYLNTDGTAQSEAEFTDENNNSVISSIKINLPQSSSSVAADGTIDSSVDLDENTKVDTQLKPDGSVSHQVKSADKTTSAKASLPGSKVEVTKKGEIQTKSQIKEGGFLYEAIAVSTKNGKTKTKFIKIDLATGQSSEVANTLSDASSYESGNEVEISKINGRVFIKTTAPLTNNLNVE